MQRLLRLLCTVPIQSYKRLENCSRDEAVTSSMFEFYIFEYEWRSFNSKSPLILGSKSCWGISRRIPKLKLLLTHLPDFLPSRHVWNFPRLAPYQWIHEQVTSQLFGEYACFQRGYRHSYSSFYFILSMLQLKTILVIDVEHDSSALGAVQNEQVGGIFFLWL